MNTQTATSAPASLSGAKTIDKFDVATHGFLERHVRELAELDAQRSVAESSHLIIDPANPYHLVAYMWEFRRWPWFFKSGGAG